MKVTVVCPLYNKRDYIEKTILSVQKQSYKNWEMIIVDDGSTDDSCSIVEDYVKNDSRIRLLRRENISSNKGANVCRNIGIDKSEGDYIVFLDADDLLESYCLEQRTKYISQYPARSFYVFNVAYCRGEDAIPYSKFQPNFIDKLKYALSKNKKEYFLKQFLKFELAWHTSGPIWDKECLRFLGGFNERFQRLQDPEIHTRALLDDRTTFEYLMNTTTHDVLHRTDDDRVVWDKLEFFRKRIDSIHYYLSVFIPIVKRQREVYLYKLQGYLLQAETLAYRSVRDEKNGDDIKAYISQMNLSYGSQDIKSIYNWKYKLFLSAFRLSLKNRFLIKMKIPGVLLLFYKKVVL